MIIYVGGLNMDQPENFQENEWMDYEEEDSRNFLGSFTGGLAGGLLGDLIFPSGGYGYPGYWGGGYGGYPHYGYGRRPYGYGQYHGYYPPYGHGYGGYYGRPGRRPFHW